MKLIKNRKQIEETIYETYSRADPTGANTRKYKELFSKMNDTEFTKFINQIIENEHEYFIFDMVDFERDISVTNAKKALDYLKVPLMESVYMSHLSGDKKRTIVSKEKCLVGYANVKRPQQLLHKKNGITISNDKVSMMTNQVINKDKNARDSDIEASMLVALGANAILQEFHGPRSDDMVMKRQMAQSIANKGYVQLEDLDNIATNKTTLMTVNTILIGMGLKPDIVTDSYILPKTSEELFD